MQYRQGCMEKNTLNLLTSELSTSISYLERIFSAVLEFPSLCHCSEINHEIQKLYLDCNLFLEDNLFLPQYECVKDNSYNISEIKNEISSIHQLIVSFLRLRPEQDNGINFAVSYINLIYEYAQVLHTLCEQKIKIEILYPRSSLAQNIFENTNNENNEIPKFELKEETIYQFNQHQNGFLESLEWKRKLKYEDLISKGHKAVFSDKNEEALEYFTKANKFLETAEALTLMAWIFSLMKENDKAKSYCLKAIKVDPNYGPPYNDIGNYLLAEGKVQDSLKWFQLAKKAPVYLNREYPYINSGRAYLLQKKNFMALEQFSKALTLAPYHSELFDTVSKLKANLEKEDIESSDNALSKIHSLLSKRETPSTNHDWN